MLLERLLSETRNCVFSGHLKTNPRLRTALDRGSTWPTACTVVRSYLPVRFCSDRDCIASVPGTCDHPTARLKVFLDVNLRALQDVLGWDSQPSEVYL